MKDTAAFDYFTRVISGDAPKEYKVLRQDFESVIVKIGKYTYFTYENLLGDNGFTRLPGGPREDTYISDEEKLNYPILGAKHFKR